MQNSGLGKLKHFHGILSPFRVLNTKIQVCPNIPRYLKSVCGKMWIESLRRRRGPIPGQQPDVLKPFKD